MKKTLKNVGKIIKNTINKPLAITTIAAVMGIGIPQTTKAQQVDIQDLQTNHIIPDSLSARATDSLSWYQANNNSWIISSDSVKVFSVDTLNSELKTPYLVIANDSSSLDSTSLSDVIADQNNEIATLYTLTNDTNGVNEAWKNIKELYKEFDFNIHGIMDPNTANGASVEIKDKNGNIVAQNVSVSGGAFDAAFTYIGSSADSLEFIVTKTNTLGKDTIVFTNKIDTVDLGSLTPDYVFNPVFGTINNSWTSNPEEGVELTIIDIANGDTLFSTITDINGNYMNTNPIHYTKDTVDAHYTISKNAFNSVDTTIQIVSGQVHNSFEIDPILYGFSVIGSTNPNIDIAIIREGTSDTLANDPSDANGVIYEFFQSTDSIENVIISLSDPTGGHAPLDTAFTLEAGNNGMYSLPLDSIYTHIIQGSVSPNGARVVFTDYNNPTDTLVDKIVSGGVYSDTLRTTTPNYISTGKITANGFEPKDTSVVISPGTNTFNLILDSIIPPKVYDLMGTNGTPNVNFTIKDLAGDSTITTFQSDANGMYSEQFSANADSMRVVYIMNASGYEDKNDTVWVYHQPSINLYNANLDQIVHSYPIRIGSEPYTELTIANGNDTIQGQTDVNGLFNDTIQSTNTLLTLNVHAENNPNFEEKDTVYVAQPDQQNTYLLHLPKKEMNGFFLWGSTNPDSVRMILVDANYPSDTLFNIVSDHSNDTTGTFGENFQHPDSSFTGALHLEYIGNNGVCAPLDTLIELEQGSNFGYFKLRDITGVEELNNNKIGVNVYPNPSPNGQYMIQYQAMPGKELDIDVYDASGRKVYHNKSPANGKMMLNLSNFPAGEYNINIKSDNKESNKKLIKK